MQKVMRNSKVSNLLKVLAVAVGIAIASGNFLTDIAFLAQGNVTQQLLDTGYDAKNLNGSHTIAFKFNKSALTGIASVPEPSSIVSLAAIGLVVSLLKRYK